MAKSSGFSKTKILGIVLAVFFIVTGLVGIMNYNSSVNQVGRAIGSLFGRNGGTVALLVAIAQLVIGGIILADLFMAISAKTMNLAKLIILILWAVFMVITHLLGNNFLQPDLLSWLQPLSLDAVVLVSLWIIKDAEI